MSTETKPIEHFSEDILQALQHGIVKSIEQQATSLVTLPPYNQRPTLPADVVQKVYALINVDQVLDSLRAEINERVATMICQNMLEELKTDVKKVLSHEPTRLRLRMIVAGEIDKIKVADWKEKYASESASS